MPRVTRLVFLKVLVSAKSGLSDVDHGQDHLYFPWQFSRQLFFSQCVSKKKKKNKRDDETLFPSLVMRSIHGIPTITRETYMMLWGTFQHQTCDNKDDVVVVVVVVSRRGKWDDFGCCCHHNNPQHYYLPFDNEERVWCGYHRSCCRCMFLLVLTNDSSSKSCQIRSTVLARQQ
jgi:hypothetical protein